MGGVVVVVVRWTSDMGGVVVVVVRWTSDMGGACDGGDGSGGFRIGRDVMGGVGWGCVMGEVVDLG